MGYVGERGVCRRLVWSIQAHLVHVPRQLQRHTDRLVVRIQGVLVHRLVHVRRGGLVLRVGLGDAVPPVPQQHLAEDGAHGGRRHVHRDAAADVLDVHQLWVLLHVAGDHVADGQRSVSGQRVARLIELQHVKPPAKLLFLEHQERERRRAVKQVRQEGWHRQASERDQALCVGLVQLTVQHDAKPFGGVQQEPYYGALARSARAVQWGAALGIDRGGVGPAE